MAAIIGFFVGAIFGAITAARRGGNLGDILLYGTVFGIILALITQFGAIIAFNAGWL